MCRATLFIPNYFGLGISAEEKRKSFFLPPPVIWFTLLLHMIDPALIDAAHRGDRIAQKQLFVYCYNLLMGICMRYEQDEGQAKALLNVVFLKIFDNLEKYQPEQSFEAWAKRIAVNAAIDAWRRRKKELERIRYVDFSDAANRHLDGVDYNEADRLLNREALEQMVRTLPELSRKVFNLYAIEGYKHAEIAAMLEISESTSRWHLSRARRLLQTYVARALREEQTIVRKIK